MYNQDKREIKKIEDVGFERVWQIEIQKKRQEQINSTAL